ncbi:hypothetical protein J3R30DRAFT_3699990 [Lentinula aciculospora]|uniref:L domain-like protein n=1 Tax=Lentinula aciculospora TaxID=153920 RepID=A0A9W9AI61_9AGAR|nr:hypothetical protein J3R30DRAFT_3699990 [Lentinula aciculospora]
MSGVAGPSRPAWQTEELEDEWIEPEPEGGEYDDEDQFDGTRSISFTAPLSTQIHTINEIISISSNPEPMGTFLVHESIPTVPLLPKTPGWNKKANIKDFFSPMPLERMFEPPSPPPQPSQLPPRSIGDHPADEIMETDIPNMVSFDGRKPSADCQFTFSAPRSGFLNLDNQPQAESTPGNPTIRTTNAPPSSDLPLRLFQFQYDTYTREHLSAMVDSIAVNPALGSGTTNSPASLDQGLSRVSEATRTHSLNSHLRSAKRVKLSPKSDFQMDARPKLSGKDYVGESQSLMQQIKRARDFSTISTVASAQEQGMSDTGVCGFHSVVVHYLTSVLTDPTISHTKSALLTSGAPSSTKFRLQAATLMAQIKNDMKGQKRIFSDDSESYATVAETYSESRRSPRRNKPRLSPRRALRRSATRKEEDDLACHLSQVSFSSQNSTSAPHLPSNIPQLPRIHFSSEASMLAVAPSALSSSRFPPSTISANDDLNRFVSSSTASSGTTLTAGSIPSFVKHSGPAHIRTIAPSEVPPLDRLGNMVFDKVMMKWVKNSPKFDENQYSPEEISEDPFGDIESLKDDFDSMVEESIGSMEEHDVDTSYNELSRVEEQSEIDDTEEMELTSFETDHPNSRLVHVVSGFFTGDGIETSDSEDDAIPHEPVNPIEYDSEEDHAEEQELKGEDDDNDDENGLMNVAPQPSRVSSSPDTPNRVIPPFSSMRSAMKTPESVLKEVSGARYRTPQRNSKHRRSVSFSDGKRDGPIRGLNKNADTGDVTIPGGNSRSGFIPSVRSRRIANMLVALEDSDCCSDKSPSKASGPSDREIRPLGTSPVSNNNDMIKGLTSSGFRHVFSKSQRHSQASSGTATFLTECSFGIAHDRLVQVITDVEPFEPHWEELYSIDLSGKNLESAARLKEFLPHLDCLKINSNLLSWLSGVPSTVRTLSVACNSLTGLTSYHHLLNLENLDISRNEVDSLIQLSCLRHLRELKADWNKITSLEGLERMDGLVKLSVQGNHIRSVDVPCYRWSVLPTINPFLSSCCLFKANATAGCTRTRLEMLNISENRLDRLIGLASSPSLIALNVDHNSLDMINFDGPMPRLKILRASGNRISVLDTSFTPNIRTLYLDNNSLTSLTKLDRLTKLENLSLRNQSGKGCKFLTRDTRDVKRLYLSGNALGGKRFLTESCYNLVYLELAACRITTMPDGLASMIPNVRVLNLNYNFLEDARPLEGLSRLQKLTMIGSRLKGTKALIRLLQRMPEVEMLDFRMNPCTLGWYLPLLVKDVPGALQPSEDGRKGDKGANKSAWQELDAKFRRDLPNDSYIGRLAYRGLVMQACPRIRMLDGIEVTGKEKLKAEKILVGILGKKKKRAE